MNSELEKLLGSTDAAIRRAYALGRKDALDQMVKYARADDGLPPLALPSPEPGLSEHIEHDAPAHAGASAIAPTGANDDAAEARYMRVEPKRAGNGGITGMIMDFVYPSKAG